MPRIFISHSSLDREVIEREIISPLRAHGLDTWYSTDNIKSASEWERQIHQGLKACDWFLIVLSPRSVASEWVQREVHWAILKRKDRIVPVMLENCDPDELHLGLLPIQFIDFRNDLKEGQERLLELWGLDKPGQVKTRYQAAQDALAKEDWATAIEALETVLRLDPSHAQAQTDLNRAQQHQQLASLYETATTQLREKQWRDALETLQQVSAIDDDYKDVAELIASANAGLEKEEAGRLYLQASDAMSREDWATAVEQLESALKLDASHTEAQAALNRASQQTKLAELYAAGRAHLESKQWNEALKSFRSVRAVDKNYKNVSELIAEADAGITEEEELVQREQREGEAQEEAARQERERQAREAQQLYLDALNDIAQENWKAARKKLQSVKAGGPENAEIAAKLAEVERQLQLAKLFESGIQHSRNKRWAEALRDFRQLQETAGTYKSLATHIKQAEAELEKLQNPPKPKPPEPPAVKQVEPEKPKETETKRDDNEKASPTDTTAAVSDDTGTRQTKLLVASVGGVIVLVVLAYVLWPRSSTYSGETYPPSAMPSPSATASGVASTNENANSNTSAYQPDTAADYYNKGEALFGENKYAEAAAEYRKAVDLEPSNASYHNQLGRSLYAQGTHEQEMYERAEEEFREAIKLDRKAHEHWYNLGLALKEQNRPGDAADAFREATKRNQNNANYHNEFGDVLYKTKRHEEAEYEYEWAVRLAPKNTEYIVDFGNALYMQGKYQEADVEYRKALRLDPNNKAAKDNIKNVRDILSKN